MRVVEIARKFLVPALAIGLFVLLRLLWSAAVLAGQRGTITAPDSHEYLALAERLLLGEKWHLPHRLPVYPVFLVVVKLLGAESLPTVSLVQFVLVWLVSGVCFWLIGRTAGFVLVVAWTGAITLSLYILGEGLAICTVALAALFTIRALNRKRKADATVSGMLWALASLTKGVLLLVPALAIALSTMRLGRGSLRRLSLWFLTGLATPLILWLAHNKITWGRWFLSSAEEFNLLWYHASAIVAENESKPLPEVQDSLWQTLLANHQALWQKNWIDFYRECGREALRIIIAHPLLALKNIAIYGMPLLAKPPYGWMLLQAGLPYQPARDIGSHADLPWWMWLWLTADVLTNLLCILILALMLWKWKSLHPSLKTLLIASLSGAIALVLAGGAPLICDGRLRLPLQALWLTTAACWLAKTWGRKFAPA